MEVSTRFPRWLLALVAGCIVTYCVLVLAVVATAPDLRLRFLLSDAASANIAISPVGIQIQQLPDTGFMGPAPVVGDLLVSLDQQEVGSFLDFARIQLALRNRDISANGLLPVVADPLTDGKPSLVQTADGKRWVKIEYIKRGAKERQTCAVQLQSIPISEVGLTLVWFLLQLLIFSVGAVAFWNRPFDESARRFFVMSTATLAAFIGGFHWATVAGSFWLTLPFGVCGILLPALTLHFFSSIRVRNHR